MSLPDPLSINIGAGAVTLPRVSTGSFTSTYTSADGNISIVVSNQYNKRTRRAFRVNVKKTAADPLFPAQNAPYTTSVYIVMDVPSVGFTSTEMVSIAGGLMAVLTASTNANLVKFSQGEN